MSDPFRPRYFCIFLFRWPIHIYRILDEFNFYETGTTWTVTKETGFSNWYKIEIFVHRRHKDISLSNFCSARHANLKMTRQSTEFNWKQRLDGMFNSQWARRRWHRARPWLTCISPSRWPIRLPACRLPSAASARISQRIRHELQPA